MVKPTHLDDQPPAEVPDTIGSDADRPTTALEVEPTVSPASVGALAASTPAATMMVVASKAPAAEARRAIPAIAGYEILGELGRGGMGVVYRGRQLRLNRPCALKMILAGAHATPEAIARFLGEAEAIARLQHRNIVQIYSIGEVEGLPYLELEYLPGGGLDQRLDGSPWPTGKAGRLVEILARAMAEAHRLGVVHRDLKPANILVAADGTPKIADFGLAKAMGGESSLTRSDSILGSPSYMAPEQAGGFTREAGPTADIYSLGAVLYELLTGRPPFRGASMLETLEQVKTAEPVPPSRLVPKLPRDIETICLKCLEKDPAKRYADAAALAEDLRRFRANEPILARPIGIAERAWRWCRRNQAIAALAGTIAMVLLLGSAGSTYFGFRAIRGERLASQKATEAMASARKANEESARAGDEARKADAQARRADLEARRANEESRHARDEKLMSDRRLYVAEMNLAQQAWRVGRVDLMQQHLQELVPKRPEDPDPRGFEWYYRQRLRESDLRTMSGHSMVVHGVAFSPDGRLIASAGADQTVKIWDAATGREVRTLKGHVKPADRVAFSPDGRTLASSGWDSTVRLWEVATGREIRSLVGHRGQVRGLAYSPDGGRLASCSEHGELKVWDPATGREIGPALHKEGGFMRLAYSPDGRTIAATSIGIVGLWDAATGREIRTLRGHSGLVLDVAFSPDGRRLASAGGDHAVRLWDVATGREILALRGHMNRVFGVAFSRDGRTLASAGWDHTVRLWDPDKGGEILTLRGHMAGVSGVAFSPDGRTLASASLDRTVKLWDASMDPEAMTVRGLAGPVGRVTFSPDGRILASAGMGDAVRLWDAITGMEIRRFPGPGMGSDGLAFSPDGRMLAAPGSGEGQKSVRLWEIATGEEVRALRGHEGQVPDLAFSPDGRILAICAGMTVKLWEAGTGRELRTLRGHEQDTWRVSFSPDGRTLASGSFDKTVRLWDVATGREIRALRGDWDSCQGVAFSPDGRLLAAAVPSGSADGEQAVKVWEAATGREVLTLRGHPAPVGAIAFSPDGRRLAAACHDGTAWLWDVATGQSVLTLSGGSAVAFSPDGRKLATGGDAMTIKIWDATPMTPDLRVLREARGVVAVLGGKSLPRGEILDRIRKDLTLSTEVRRSAEDLARRAPPAEGAPNPRP